MNRRVLASALLVALALLALLLWREHVARPRPREATAPVATTPAPRAPPEPEERSPAPRASVEPLRLSPAERADDVNAPAGALHGRVLSWGDQTGVRGAELTFFRGGASYDVTADAAGEFLFTAPEPGDYQLAAVAADGFVPFTPSLGQSHVRFAARPGTRVSGVFVYLTPLDTYVGEIEDQAGKPIGGARVEVLELAAVEEALASRESVATSDAVGAVHIAAPAGYTLLATHPSYAPTRVTLGWTAQATRSFTVTMAPREGAPQLTEISGLVLDPRGAPYQGALVRAFARDQGGAQSAAVLSDDAGRFLLTSLAPGRYSLLATSPAHARAHAVANAGEREVRLTLGVGGEIVGRVSAAAEPVVSFSIIADLREGYGQRVQSFFDADGRFRLAALPPGEYAVRAVAHGLSPSEQRVVTVTAGQVASVELTLRRGARIHGRVVAEENGAPLAGASVSSENDVSPDDAPAAIAARVVTDAAGRFELTGLTLGLRSIFVQAPGRHSRLVSGLSIEPDGNIGPLTIELARVAPGEEPRIEVTGIGAMLSKRDDVLVIVKSFPGGGAAAAGLVEGDAIVAIDGAFARDLEVADAFERIRGPEGTLVRLLVRKKGAAAPHELVVRRQRVRMD